MVISKEDEIRILELYDFPCKIKLGNKYYYIKQNNIDCALKEILGSRLATLVGLNAAKYDIVGIGTDYYILSEDISNDGNFVIGEGFITNYSKKYGPVESLSNLWYFLEKYSDVDKLMFDITKIYMFDIILMNFVRHYNNFGILESKEGNKVYIFDNETLLNHKYLPSITTNTNQEGYYKNNFKIYCDIILQDVENFLNISTSEFVDEFKMIHHLLNPSKVKEEINNVVKEYHFDFCDKKTLEEYETLYYLLKETLDNYKYKNK